MKLGVNSVLFGGYDFATAAKMIAKSGYDGIEISAIKGMCEHLVLDEWESQKDEILRAVEENNLQILSMEVAALDEERLTKAFAAAKGIGIPIVNVGPGGKSDVEEDFAECVEKLNRFSKLAEEHGVTLCVKAHVGGAIYSTPTTLRAMNEVNSPAFGIDMDPSHIYRANENPEQAISDVISRVKHVHIRDCKGRQQNPGLPPMQACGRGDIDLYGYLKVLADAKYDGPVCLEVIGANEMPLEEVTVIAAESYGYLNACLKHLKAR